MKMACFWFFVSQFLLLLSQYQNITFGHAFEIVSAIPDTNLPAAGFPETDLPDAVVPEAGLPDTSIPDVSLPENGFPDASNPDIGLPENSLPDADFLNPTLPELDLPVLDDVNLAGIKLGSGKRRIRNRAPQDQDTSEDEDMSSNTPDNTSTEDAEADQDDPTNTTSDNTVPEATSTATDGQDESDNSENDDTSEDVDDVRGEQPVVNYQPSIGPIEDDADYPNHNGEVMNSTDGTQPQYQYQILINADAYGEPISLSDEYASADTSSMLKCASLCNSWNQKHDNTVVCQAVSYYGNGECYLLRDLFEDGEGRYAYYAAGSILGLVLRDPSYPAPTETSPPPDTSDGEYISTTTTTTLNTPSPYTTATTGPVYTGDPVTSSAVPGTIPQVTYSSRTIMPTDAYGKTTVELYISSCPTPY